MKIRIIELNWNGPMACREAKPGGFLVTMSLLVPLLSEDLN